MTTLTETRHAGGFIVWEALRDCCREVVTLATGGGNLVLEPGTVLWGKADATTAYVDAVVLLRGPAIVNANDLVFVGTPIESGRNSNVSLQVFPAGIASEEPD